MNTSTITRQAATVGLAGLLTLGAAGCSSDDVAEAIADKAGDAVGADVDVDSDGEGVSVKDADGNGFETKATAEVPAEVSAVVAIPDAFQAEGTTETTMDEGTSYMVQGTIDTDDPEAVLDGIEEPLLADGFETMSKGSVAGEMHTLLMSNDENAQVTVGIVADGEGPHDMNVTVLRTAD